MKNSKTDGVFPVRFLDVKKQRTRHKARPVLRLFTIDFIFISAFLKAAE